jgi:hypothetical protein
VPFGLDKLGTAEAASYIGVQPETLRDKVKRRQLGLPTPYSFARKLFWRRSEVDAWIEAQRPVNLNGLLQPKGATITKNPDGQRWLPDDVTAFLARLHEAGVA